MNLIEEKKDTNESLTISVHYFFNVLNKYMNEERNIYISKFGEYLSRKTSFINDFIEENFFETSFNVNTNKGILFKIII